MQGTPGETESALLVHAAACSQSEHGEQQSHRVSFHYINPERVCPWLKQADLNDHVWNYVGRLTLDKPQVYVVKVSEQVIWPPDLSALSQEGIYYMPRTGEELSGPWNPLCYVKVSSFTDSNKRMPAWICRALERLAFETKVRLERTMESHQELGEGVTISALNTQLVSWVT